MSQLIITSNPDTNKRIILFFFFNILKKVSHFEYMVVVKISRAAVQIVLCITNSTGFAKETNLK